MKPVTLILGFHNHQPVGNFEHIFEDAYRQAYEPLLSVLADYPRIPFALHNSGVLWDWLLERHPDYIDRLAAMVERGQVEIMSGGYYEPILTVIPERDRQGQLGRMREFIESRFGQTPRGCWLTERIWDPHLPATLAEASLEYVVVDDSHFKSTGFTSEQMRGFFLTEENGRYIKVFPIDKRLRYLIPFRDSRETISYLRGVSESDDGCAKVLVLADDGEKFGLWPGTHDLCYKRGWLRQFCDQLMDCRDWLSVSTFGAALDGFSAEGIVYLPTASYSEMMEWALPLPAQEQYHEAVEVLEESGRFDEPASLVRGGLWRNFLVKYEESNWMHKRMLSVSDLVERYGREHGKDEIYSGAVDHLYQAQCNCAYWHGLFGGLYLPHLRSAVYRHLVRAERAVEPGSDPALPPADIDGDGVPELVFGNESIKAFVTLSGGALRELDNRQPAFNLTDTLTRREEPYHRKLSGLGGAEVREGTPSIHEISRAKEKDLDRFLVYDFHRRLSMLDHFLGEEVDLDSCHRAAYRDLGDFIGARYEPAEFADTGCVLRRTGRVGREGEAVEVDLEKRYSLGRGGTLEVGYRIRPRRGTLRCRFAVESVFSFLAGNAPDRYFEFPGRKTDILASIGETDGIAAFSLVDRSLGLELRIGLDPAATVWRYPIETVSNSESGFERVYQGSAVVSLWRLDLSEGKEAAFSITLTVGPTGG